MSNKLKPAILTGHIQRKIQNAAFARAYQQNEKRCAYDNHELPCKLAASAHDWFGSPSDAALSGCRCFEP